MAWPSLVLAASLLGTEPTALDDELDELAEPESAPAGKPLLHRTIATLIELDELAITLEVVGPTDAEQGGVDATLAVRTDVHHDHDGSVRELELAIALLGEPELGLVWDRLHTPPLQLTAAQIERKLPGALAVVTLVDDGEPFDREADRPLFTLDHHEALQLPRATPTALVVVTAYALDAPSERDVLRILAEGGPADLGALASWATATAVEGVEPFDVAARRRIVDVVEARLRGLRAPPAFGDFQRINALTAVAYACVGPDDLERLLVMQRPVSILLSGAIVSYDDAVAEENLLGVAVHGFRRLQSRSDASLQWEAALQRVRGVALDRVLRLAFDPLDFRAAPPDLRRHATLQVAATELLAPLDVTDAGRALALTVDHPGLQRGVLEFYVDVGHAPVVEPLVDWLVANPAQIDELGAHAMARMGAALLPVLLRRFGDFEVPTPERAVVWRLLAALPERHAAALAEACGSIGVELPPHAPGTTPAVAELLQAIRTADELAQQRRVAELVARVRDGEGDRVALRARVQAVQEIAELAPARLPELADEAIALHVAAARELATDGPSGPRVVIAQLRRLPLGARARDAVRAAVLIEAELHEAAGDRDAALAALEHDDPGLTDLELRARYVAIVEQQLRELVDAGAWDAASLLLDRAESFGLDELDSDRWRASIFAMRRRPLVALGVVVALLVLVLAFAVLHRSGALARLRARAGAPTPGTGGLEAPHGEEPHEELAEAWDRDDDTRSPLDEFAA